MRILCFAGHSKINKKQGVLSRKGKFFTRLFLKYFLYIAKKYGDGMIYYREMEDLCNNNYSYYIS